MIRWIWAILFASAAHAQFQPVDINLASKEQLMALPGVGDKLSKRMMARRQQKGLFRGMEDLASVEGVKPSLLEKLQGKVSFGRALRASSVAPTRAAAEPSPKLEIREILTKGPTREEIETLMARFGSEPGIRQVQEAALRYANAEPARIASWLERVRHAAWAPRLTTSGGRDYDNGQSVREKVGDADILYRRDSADWRLDLKAEWHLSELVFNRDEISVSRESARQTLLRERIVTDVTRQYFARRRLQVELALGAQQDAVLQVQGQLKIAEHTAMIDGYTGGWFSQNLEQHHGS